MVANSGKQLSGFYDIAGRLLISIGIALAFGVGVFVLDENLQRQVEKQSSLLMVPGTPVFSLIPATVTPTATSTLPPPPTATATFTPITTPPPPIRVRIPYINVNSMIVEVKPIVYTTYSGEIKAQWDIPAYAVGHNFSSGNPGAGTNIVLTGHNNFLGEVFRDLYLLKEGKEIILYSNEGEWRYTIKEITVVPYLRDRVTGEATIQEYMAPTDQEQLTVISCYPYLSNADRIVIVAQLTGG